MKKKTLKVKLQESDQRYGKQIYNSVNGIFNDYSTHLSEKKPTKIIQSVSTTPFI